MVRTGQGDEDAQLIPPIPTTDLTYGDDDLLELGDERTLPPWTVVAGVAVLLALVVGLVALKRDGRHAGAPGPSAASSATPSESQQVQPIGTPIDLGQTSAVNVKLAAGRLFVLSSDPSRLGQVDAKIGELEVTRDVIVAAVLDGELFLNTDHGIYRAGPRDSVPTSLGYSGQVLEDLAADPARHRLLGVTVGYQLLEVTARGVQLKQKLEELLPRSIAVTKAGIWAIGFGRLGGSRIARINTETLKLTMVGAAD